MPSRVSHNSFLQVEESRTMARDRIVHPYIPNSVPEAKSEMLREIGVKDVEELYDQMIPRRLRLKRSMRLPEPLAAEADLKRHVEQILAKNKDCREYLSFLGGGCWQHHVPAVCDEIARRAEFLTAYSGESYSDLGRFQGYWEFQSMMGELVSMDVVCVPTYDWATALGHAVRMASRLTGRKEVLISRAISPSRLAVARNFCGLEGMRGHIAVRMVEYDRKTGMVDLKDLKSKISDKTAGVYFENPSYLGVIDTNAEAACRMAHDNGAESIVGVDPISLGVLAPPADYGADIVCGDIQPLGIHMNCGGGLGGFIASRDDERYVAEYPLHLISVASTVRPGERGFGYCRFDRSSYVARDKAKDWVGTSTGLWSILAGVYMSLMGPQGMREVGEAIVQKSRYASERISSVKGVRVLFGTHFKEFVVNFDGAKKPVTKVNKGLLRKGIFGGKDLSREFPELGKSALYCVTEMHRKEDIDRLVRALREAVA